MSNVSQRITKSAVGAYSKGSFSETMRGRRWQLFHETFPDVGEMRVLDVGGDARSWLLGGIEPGHVTLLNVGGVPDAPMPWMTGVEGDACDEELDLGAFDLVFSNSVIEHVGGHWRRGQFADLVRRSAPRYWVQTPNRYFPIEPHFFVPFAQQMPLGLRSRVVRHWPVGNYVGRSREYCFEAAQHIELLTQSEVAGYFPDAEVRAEKLGPLTKSWIAVRK